MSGRPKSRRFPSGTSVGRKVRLVGLVVAAALLLATGESRACPNGDRAMQDEQTVATVVHRPAAEMVVAATASPSVSAKRAVGVDCCGRSSGSACASAHCPACAPALLAFAPALVPKGVSPIYGLPLQAGLRHLKPPPEFRPPRAPA